LNVMAKKHTSIGVRLAEVSVAVDIEDEIIVVVLKAIKVLMLTAACKAQAENQSAIAALNHFSDKVGYGAEDNKNIFIKYSNEEKY